MPASVTVPRLGWTMEEGTFVEWLKKDGETIQPGDPLFVLESDKATENIEAIDAGILHIPPDGPKPGSTVKVGQVLGYLVADGEAIPAAAIGRAPEVRGGSMNEGNQGVRSDSDLGDFAALAPDSSSLTTETLAISPRARRVARELGIDWKTLRGSGRNGRIRERDIRAATATAGEGRVIPHTRVRKIIAARMVAGVTTAAPVTLTTKADARNLVNLRNQFQALSLSPVDAVPGYTDFLLKLTAVALRQHPLLQAQWREDGLFVPAAIHIAVAVDTEAGLFAPVVRDVDKLTVRQIASRSRELIVRARSGQLSADEMGNATFTITNLGMHGVDAFTPILHLPQCAILGVGRIVREPVVVGEQIAPRDRVTLSLTFDHRVVDGSPAARFLDTIRRCIEQPAPLLIE